MSLQRTYQRVCDGCGAVHRTLCDTARRSLAAMRRDGWVRRQMVIARMNRPDYARNSQTGEYEIVGIWGYDVTADKDFCPACAEREENR